MQPNQQSPESHLTRLEAITENGEIALVTDDASVQHKAQDAGNAVKSFTYWTGREQEIVNGRVTSMRDGTPFRFTVLAEEAGEGP